MTPKLTERLARLEATRAAADDAQAPMPPALAGAYLQAVAIGLGGYPRPPEAAPSHRQDTLSDGFARGLGYDDGATMEARIEADPDEWRERMAGAEAALTARYAPDPNGEGFGRDPALQIMFGVLDEIAGAKAEKPSGVQHHWPTAHPQLDRSAEGIRRALGLFGVVADQQITQACG